MANVHKDNLSIKAAKAVCIIQKKALMMSTEEISVNEEVRGG